MNCDDMMNLPQLKDELKLRAGRDGLKNTVRWIYFADCLQCIQSEYRIEDFIHGGELVILTNRSVTDDTGKLMPLVRQMVKHGISAIGINEGQIPGVLTTYCDDRNIPLFELAERFPLIDLSQIICQKLTLEKNSTATGIDTILSHVDDKAVLDAYVDEHIGRLLQADEIKHGSLCRTLERYLENDCNAKKTAEEMFLHRNTLNYRLKKISEILGCDFTSLDDCMKLKLAFTIRRYCNGSDLCTVNKKHGL